MTVFQPLAKLERHAIRRYIPDPDLMTTRRHTQAWRVTCSRCLTSATARHAKDAIEKLRGHECNPPAA